MNAEPAPLLSVRNLVKTFPLQHPFLWRPGVDLRAVRAALEGAFIVTGIAARPKRQDHLRRADITENAGL